MERKLAPEGVVWSKPEARSRAPDIAQQWVSNEKKRIHEIMMTRR